MLDRVLVFHIGKAQRIFFSAVFVLRLEERLHPTSESHRFKPILQTFFIEHSFAVNWIAKTPEWPNFGLTESPLFYKKGTFCMFKQVRSGWPKASRSIRNLVNTGPTNCCVGIAKTKIKMGCDCKQTKIKKRFLRKDFIWILNVE